MKIILTGGSGFIGKALLKELQLAGHRVIALTRNPDSLKGYDRNFLKPEPWDGRILGPWIDEVNGADAVINLAGESIVQRWNPSAKQRILDSRIHAAQAMVEAIRKAENKPKVLINASAIGYYGHVESGDVSENHPAGSGFSVEVCQKWENEAMKAADLGVRVVLLRIGIVLEKNGGALSRMLFPFEMFFGGPLGSGRQWFPWVHRDDIVGSILFSLENASLSGAVNATAPNPLQLSDFCKVLGQVLNRPSWAPVPGFILKLILGEAAKEILLSGAKVIPQKLLEAGYQFRYPNAQEALTAILKKPVKSPSGALVH